MAPLYSSAHDGDGRPTQGMRDVYAVLKGELDTLDAEWKAILEARRAGPRREGPRPGPGLRRRAGHSIADNGGEGVRRSTAEGQRAAKRAGFTPAERKRGVRGVRRSAPS